MPNRGPEPAHGTVERYRLRRDPCRCRRCMDAWNKYIRDRRAGKTAAASPSTKAMAARSKAAPPKAPHGTRRRYLRGCHCVKCTRANADYQREYMRLWRQGIKMIDITDVT